MLFVEPFAKVPVDRLAQARAARLAVYRTQLTGHTALVKEECRRQAPFWARGYAVSTMDFELEAVKKYIREQEQIDQDSRF